LTAGAIARQFGKISRPAVSKHLAILRRSKLVFTHRSGRELRYSLNAKPLREVEAWLRKYESFWDQQLQSSKDYVETKAKQGLLMTKKVERSRLPPNRNGYRMLGWRR